MGATQSISQPYVLETTKGRLKGIEQQDKSGKPILRRYTRIPYALPPTGNRRWRRPQTLPADYKFDDDGSQPGDFTEFGSICPQPEYAHSSVVLENPDAAPMIENTQSEDCLYLNIWVPAGSPPKNGWPVQFDIHGGWLQVGNANQSQDHDPFDLLAHSTPRIVVSATYRLNLFGFLGGEQLSSSASDPFAGNYGLWDQRQALEWTHTNISLFGGNPNNITVGGLSAGAHSAYLQLYHDSHLPESQRIIKQSYFWSNSLACQPNAIASEALTSQFDSLCKAVNVSTSLSAAEKLTALRKVSAKALVAAIAKLDYHTFRSSTDGPIEQGGFIPPSFLSSIHDGSWATKLANNHTRIVLGEVQDEALLYKLVNPPHNYTNLITQLCNYYPPHVVDELIKLPMYNIPSSPDARNKLDARTIKDIFAKIVADCQVHATIRGTTRSLLSPPPQQPLSSSTSKSTESTEIKPISPQNLFRYRVNWRAKCLDQWLDPKVGVCHAADTPIWWLSGYRAGYTAQDKDLVDRFLKPFGQFLNGDDKVDWVGSSMNNGSAGGNGKVGEKGMGVDRVRLLTAEGELVEGAVDEDWGRGLEVWDAVWRAETAFYSSN